MRGPYRQRSITEVLEAPSRDGRVRLYVEPRCARLDIGDRWQLSFGERWLTLVDRERRGGRPRSLPLARSRLVVARALPREDVALWYAARPDAVDRLVGIRAPQLLDESALGAWHQLARLRERLTQALAGRAHGVRRAFELGAGGHRVLLTDFGNRMVLFARPLFRERPRRVLEVRTDGTVLVATRDGDDRITCKSRFAVTVLGDRIRFESANRRQTASIWLPWIAPEDRRELADRLGYAVQGTEIRRIDAA